MDSRPGVLSGLHILIVEDNADAREILSSLLGYFGAFVTGAASAAQAVGMLRAATPDVVVTDIQLGDHNATWLVREARKIPSRAPFIAVSALDRDERRLEAQGFDAYLRKPLDHRRLVDTILAVMRT